MNIQKAVHPKGIKAVTLMLIAGLLAFLPMANLAAQGNTPNYRINLTATVDKHRVTTGETFRVTFKLKNTGKKQLKNVKMNWAPTRLEFTPFSGSNGASATKNNFKLNFTPFNSGGERTYSVQAKFKAGVAAGKGIENMPRVTANKAGATGSVSDVVNDIVIKVVASASGGSGNSSNQNGIHIKGSILDNEQNPRTDNYRYDNNNPKKVKAGKWFQIQFRIKNNAGQQLKNVKLNWEPSAIEFMPINNGKRGEYGRSLTANKISIEYPKFNKGAERIYTQFARFKADTPAGTSINEANKGKMPKVTAQFPNGKATENPVLTLNAVVVPPPAGIPVEITKTTSTPSPSLNAPFDYLIAVKNTSNAPQTVKLTDVNMASSVQNFTSVAIEGATATTLKIVNGEEAVQAAQEVADKLAAEEAAVQVTNDVTAKYKALKAAQKKINQLRVASKKAKIAYLQAKPGQKQAAKKKWDQAKQAVEKEKPKVKAAWDAYQAAKKAAGQPVAEAEEPAAEDIDEAAQESDEDIQQVLTGNFTLAAGATANIKLTSVIVDDSEAADAITNEAVAIIGDQHEVSDETVIALCRTAECIGSSSEVIPTPGSASSDALGGGGSGPAQIASTGPAAVAASIIGVSAIGYGARQWIASRRAMHEAMSNLYKPDHHDHI